MMLLMDAYEVVQCVGLRVVDTSLQELLIIACIHLPFIFWLFHLPLFLNDGQVLAATRSYMDSPTMV